MKKIIVWGAGVDGQHLFDMLAFDCEIIAFIDEKLVLQGKYKMGIPILTPEKALQYNFDYVIIANKNGKILRSRLIKTYQIPENKILDFINNPVYDALFVKYPDPRLSVLSNIKSIIDTRQLEGAVAELGVYKGDFAKYINYAFPNKKLYLFDTFSGFDVRDIEQEQIFSNAKENDFLNEDISLILNKMNYPEKCIIKSGYFPESLNGLEDQFCFVSLDADLYTPILNGLEYFYPRLVQGGYILVHDYTNPIFTGAKQAVHDYCFTRNIPFVSFGACESALILK